MQMNGMNATTVLVAVVVAVAATVVVSVQFCCIIFPCGSSNYTNCANVNRASNVRFTFHMSFSVFFFLLYRAAEEQCRYPSYCTV